MFKCTFCLQLSHSSRAIIKLPLATRRRLKTMARMTPTHRPDVDLTTPPGNVYRQPAALKDSIIARYGHRRPPDMRIITFWRLCVWREHVRLGLTHDLGNHDRVYKTCLRLDRVCQVWTAKLNVKATAQRFRGKRLLLFLIRLCRRFDFSDGLCTWHG